MLQTKKKKVTFVLYEDQKVARAFELNKNKVKFFLTSLSLLFLVMIVSSLFLIANMKNMKDEISKQEPLLKKKIIEEEKKYKEKIENLESLNRTYLNKISSSKVETDSILPLFNPTLGFKDLSGENYLNIENIIIKTDGKKTFFDFNIVNSKENANKISGYIFILMQFNASLFFYPEKNLIFDDAVSNFNMGETFTISRFRQVKGIFKALPKSSDDTKFKILIFNRTGDLIHKQSIGPVKVKKNE